MITKLEKVIEQRGEQVRTVIVGLLDNIIKTQKNTKTKELFKAIKDGISGNQNVEDSINDIINNIDLPDLTIEKVSFADDSCAARDMYPVKKKSNIIPIDCNEMRLDVVISSNGY